jgi:selenium metabolism protein YedF
LIRSFFHTLGEVEPLPETILFFNTGVKLTCEGSQVLDDLRVLETKGIEMLVCGTCLGYFELTEKLAVGQVSNMYDIAETMLGAGTIVNL